MNVSKPMNLPLSTYLFYSATFNFLWSQYYYSLDSRPRNGKLGPGTK